MKATPRAVPVAASVSVLALASGLTTADAVTHHHFLIATHVTIKHTGSRFSGNVKAIAGRCVSERKVTLYRKPSTRLGSARTDSSGHWTITASSASGHFYAKARRLVSPPYTCKVGKSKTIS